MTIDAEDGAGNLLHLRVRGRVTTADQAALLNAVGKAVERHGRIRLLITLADFEGTLLFVSHDRRFLSALSNRVLELGAEGPKLYGGGYTEYVSATGQEAPGLH